MGVDDSLGTQMCGPLVYYIQTATGVQTDIVRLSGDLSTLIYEPVLEDGPGGRFIDLQLVAYLRDYPDIAPGVDNFRVFLQDCAADIDATNVVAQLQDQTIVWGDEAVPYFVDSILDDYI